MCCAIIKNVSSCANIATFYPDGKTPVAGTAFKQPDGTYKFVAHNPLALPADSTLPGTLKTDSQPDGIRGKMASTQAGEGTFTPDGGNTRPGKHSHS